MAGPNGVLTDAQLRVIPWSDSGQRLAVDACRSLIRMNAAYRKKYGKDLIINEGYRSLYRQRLYWANRGKPGWPTLAAYPGTSQHGFGNAVDISTYGAGYNSSVYWWLNKYGKAYGWYQPNDYKRNGRYPEPWHWEYMLSWDTKRDEKVEDEVATGDINLDQQVPLTWDGKRTEAGRLIGADKMSIRALLGKAGGAFDLGKQTQAKVLAAIGANNATLAREIKELLEEDIRAAVLEITARGFASTPEEFADQVVDEFHKRLAE